MSGTNETIGGGGFHHVAVRTADFDATVGFYTQALGFRPTLAWGAPGKRAIMLDTGDGSCLEVFENAGQKPAADDAAIIHFALRTRDAKAAIERARRAGYAVTMEPTDLDIPSSPKPTPVRIAFCKGPDGVLVEFFQSR
ncbi:MAG: VOC family protein [Phycisphaerae bacterium]|nr:VOC family protein [Phycisphaerae bacterium]